MVVYAAELYSKRNVVDRIVRRSIGIIHFWALVEAAKSQARKPQARRWLSGRVFTLNRNYTFKHTAMYFWHCQFVYLNNNFKSKRGTTSRIFYLPIVLNIQCLATFCGDKRHLKCARLVRKTVASGLSGGQSEQSLVNGGIGIMAASAPVVAVERCDSYAAATT